MANALLTGVSGLIAHQRMLDVIGNNLANLNTTAYKSQRTLFADLLYQTLRPASSSSSTDIGGLNPIQIGSGVSMTQVDRNFAQGNLEATGSLLDFAMQGEGFFVMSDGVQNVFSRAGSFVLDEGGKLVDPTSGYPIQRFGTVGEPDGVNPGFQVPGDLGIVIPFGASIPGEPTSNVALTGNLDAGAIGPLAEVHTSISPYLEGGAAATVATLLNNLDSNVAAYGGADAIQISGSETDGTPIATSLAVGAATTLGDLLSAISAAYSGATASLDANGNLVLTADNVGDALLSLSLSDAGGNTGGTSFANHTPNVTTNGKVGDIVQSSVEIFDVRGGQHTIALTFQKQGDNVWDMTAGMSAAEGTLVDDSVQQIQFNDEGSIQQVLGTGIGDANIEVQFNGITMTQSISFSLGSSNSFDGLTHFGGGSSMAALQNGFAPGSLASINVSSDGIIAGVATNGRTFEVAQLAIASFRNVKGLQGRGNNLYEESLNSGPVQLGTALSGDRGSISVGQLEGSNVDIAFEFTRLIVAQRGFSANARTITVTDEVLEELTNLIR